MHIYIVEFGCSFHSMAPLNGLDEQENQSDSEESSRDPEIVRETHEKEEVS